MAIRMVVVVVMVVTDSVTLRLAAARHPFPGAYRTHVTGGYRFYLMPLNLSFHKLYAIGLHALRLAFSLILSIR